MKLDELYTLINEIIQSAWWTLLSPVIMAILSLLGQKINSSYKKRIASARSSNGLWYIGVRYYFQCMELLLPIVTYIFIIYISITFIDFDHQKKNIYALFYIVFIGCAIMISGIIGNKNDKSVWDKIIIECIFLVLFEIWIFSIACKYVMNVDMLYLLILITTLLFYLGEETIIFRNIYYREYSRKRLLILKNFRWVIGLLFITYMVICAWCNDVLYLNLVSNVYISLWVVVCFVERFIIVSIDDTNIEYEVCMKYAIERTQKKIVQYRKNKIRFILKDGTIKIVDKDDIIYIKCVLQANISSKEEKGYCILKDNTNFKFNKCRYYNDSWVEFTLIENKTKEILIYNSNVIREITGKTKQV